MKVGETRNEQSAQWGKPLARLAEHTREVLAKEVVIRGQTLRPGQPVLFLYASANRDEAEFPDPDRFDITRRPPRILSFGHGQHSCLGIHVAKLEGRIALNTLLSRCPNYELDLEVSERYVTEFVQGFSRLTLKPQG